MPSAFGTDAREAQAAPTALPDSLAESAWNDAPTGKRPHELTHAYARKLLAEIQVAQERLEQLMAEHDPTVAVTAITAVPMDDLLRVKVIAKGEQLFHAPIYLIEKVDPSILGGIILETSGRRYDMSVHAQLSAVHKGLIAKEDEEA